MITPPVNLGAYSGNVDISAAVKTHPLWTAFIAGAVTMYVLPPFLGGVVGGARDELRSRRRGR